MFRDLNILVTVSVLGLTTVFVQGCGDHSSSQGPANTDAVTEAAADTESANGVFWQTDPERAFEEARTSGRPVMLYFTADWCPPCHDLRAHVFPQPGFVEKSRLFVPVYLDSDQPQAQMWVEKFGVIGYPTLVVLNSTESEIVRVSGGMNLAAYEEVLDTALSVTQPIDDLLASLDGASDVPSESCRRLAFHAWSSDSAYADSEYDIGTKLLAASQNCPVELPVVRARLNIVAASLLAPAAASEMEDSEAIDPVMLQALQGVYEISQIPELADPNALLFLSAPGDFYVLSHRFGEVEGVDVVTPWVESLARFADDTENTSFTRLFAVGGRVALIRGADEGGGIPEADIISAREAVTRLLNEEEVGYGRSALLLPAVFTLTTIGDDEAAQTLLLEELQQAQAPYYQMTSLAELFEDAGDHSQALEWYERAYDNSKGVETRLEWGSDYATACIRLDPDNHQRVIAAAKATINEIEGTSLSARAKRSIDRLESSLTEWNAEGDHDAAIAEIRSAMLEMCGRMGAQRDATCEAFLGPDA